MNKMKAFGAATAVATMLAACSGPNGQPTKSDVGLGVGAIAGGVIGNQFGQGQGRAVATAVGAVIGGVVGSSIGASMDEADRRAAAEAEFLALEKGPSDQARSWRNPDSGHYGTVTPGRPYQRGARDCRDYTHTIYVQGQPETLRGTACRNPDGTWHKVA